ncbi:MAG: hypothetical protein KatS3mg003_1855 [Candidatus Nitrosocaldaceae archaeon]|nr:MAG: hypothetical protein KatS3mg003_1855 [Candidatus Nitrosocaldaceae archaeon]
MVLNKKKVPKELYDWLIDEAMRYHEGNEEVMNKVLKESENN